MANRRIHEVFFEIRPWKMPKLKFLTAEPRSETWWLQQLAAAAVWSVYLSIR